MWKAFCIVFLLARGWLSADTDHWAFEPIEEPESRPISIDTLVGEKLVEKGLEWSPEADRQTLIRRLYLAMLGIPPSVEEIEAFVAYEAPNEIAWSRVVDRVLADPRYGERWALHWLDTIRWAETVGFETNAPRPNAWHYRDWVIESFNRDQPYDQFIFEQLAGDTCEADAALGFLVAGPANLPGQIGRDELAMRSARQDELDEVIRTVSQTFLGLTVGCARCHDHKFDPISAKDYYAMQAVFAGLRYGDRRRRGPENDAWTGRVPYMTATVRKLAAELEALRIRHGLKTPLGNVETVSFEPLLAQTVRMRINATTNGSAASLYEFEVWQGKGADAMNVALASRGAKATASSFALENQTRHPDCLNDGSVDERQAFAWRAGANGPAWVRIDLVEPAMLERVVWQRGYSQPADYVIEVQSPGTTTWNELAHTRDHFPTRSDTRAAASITLRDLTKSDVAEIVRLNGELRRAQAELARLQAGPQTYAASFTDKPDTTWLLHRGDPMQRREVVAPSVPVALGSLGAIDEGPEVRRRIRLARHLAEPNHPLTARVLVNRVWQYHFGTGFVDTPSDFGKMGSLPTHPSLLDWLASDFMNHGWSIKHLHRRILHSRTFLQSSRPDALALKVDADTRFLWRFPPRRVAAEVIRDSMLAASGKLNRRAHGVGFDFFRQQGGLSDYQAHETFESDGWRRMVYARKIRMQAVDVFGTFDCPDAGQMTPRRTRSITPVQSLGLMNSPFALRQAGFFAKRIVAEVGGDPEAQVSRAIEIALNRQAEVEERRTLAALARDHGLDQVCRVLFNTSEFIHLP